MNDALKFIFIFQNPVEIENYLKVQITRFILLKKNEHSNFLTFVNYHLNIYKVGLIDVSSPLICLCLVSKLYPIN